MDLNTRIIEAVREYPTLYKFRSINFEERKECWRQLSQKLQLQEQYLKIRWHSLVQRYQRDINFKYRDKMKFLQVTETLVNKNIACITSSAATPQFEISEKDLSNKSNEEEYVFLEIDDGTDCNNYSEENPSKMTTTTPTKKGTDIKKLQTITKRNVEEDENNEKVKTISIPTAKASLNSSANKSTTDCGNQSRLDIIQNAKNNNNNERCEDVIFGELVTAILKRMDDEKKRNVKKDIMNLLLS